jgi:hypothetical protein
MEQRLRSGLKLVGIFISRQPRIGVLVFWDCLQTP